MARKKALPKNRELLSEYVSGEWIEVQIDGAWRLARVAFRLKYGGSNIRYVTNLPKNLFEREWIEDPVLSFLPEETPARIVEAPKPAQVTSGEEVDPLRDETIESLRLKIQSRDPF